MGWIEEGLLTVRTPFGMTGFFVAVYGRVGQKKEKAKEGKAYQNGGGGSKTGRGHDVPCPYTERLSRGCGRLWSRGAAELRPRVEVSRCDLVEAGGHGFYYSAVGVVVFEGPDVGAA